MQKILTTSLVAGLFILAGCAQESAPPAAAEAEADRDAAMAKTEATVAAAEETAATAGGAIVGDAEAGKRIYIYCQSCHTINEGGPNKVGPNLYGVAGNAAALKDGFSYSEPLSTAGIIWDADNLDAWIQSPSSLVPGTTMLFAGIKDPQQRADLVAYMQQAAP